MNLPYDLKFIGITQKIKFTQIIFLLDLYLTFIDLLIFIAYFFNLIYTIFIIIMKTTIIIIAVFVFESLLK